MLQLCQFVRSYRVTQLIRAALTCILTMIQSMELISKTEYFTLINFICLGAVPPTPNAVDLPQTEGEIVLFNFMTLHIRS